MSQITFTKTPQTLKELTSRLTQCCSSSWDHLQITVTQSLSADQFFDLIEKHLINFADISFDVLVKEFKSRLVTLFSVQQNMPFYQKLNNAILQAQLHSSLSIEELTKQCSPTQPQTVIISLSKILKMYMDDLSQSCEKRLEWLFSIEPKAVTVREQAKRLQIALSFLLFEQALFSLSLEETGIGCYLFKHFSKISELSFSFPTLSQEEFGFWVECASCLHDLRHSISLILSGNADYLTSFVSAYDRLGMLSKNDLFQQRIPDLTQFLSAEISHAIFKEKYQRLFTKAIGEFPKTALKKDCQGNPNLPKTTIPLGSYLMQEINLSLSSSFSSIENQKYYEVKRQLCQSFCLVQNNQADYYKFLHKELDKLYAKNRLEFIGFLNDLNYDNKIKLPPSLPSFEPALIEDPFVDFLKMVLSQEEPEQKFPDIFFPLITGYTSSLLKKLDSSAPLIDLLIHSSWKGVFQHPKKRAPDCFGLLPAEWSHGTATKRGFLILAYTKEGMCFYREYVERESNEVLNKLLNPEFTKEELSALIAASLKTTPAEEPSIAFVPLEISSYITFLDGEKRVSIFPLT